VPRKKRGKGGETGEAIFKAAAASTIVVNIPFFPVFRSNKRIERKKKGEIIREEGNEGEDK